MTNFEGNYNGHYNIYHNAYDFNIQNVCLPQAVQYFKSFQAKEAPFCSVLLADNIRMASGKPIEVLQYVSHIFWTIVPILFWIAMARLIPQICKLTARKDSVLRFLMEFIIIAVPTVVSVNIVNGFVEYFVILMLVILAVTLWQTKCFAKARYREFELGKRPCMLTLARSTINLLTVLCILAIDFENFPKGFRKTRRYGVGLMDVGIGLFVFSMGSVSRRPKSGKDFLRLLRVVAPILLLGVARTGVIIAIDYHQDEHEYGRHLNAFFTLGFTKLFGAGISALARKEWQLLPLGIVILCAHEMILQSGVADYVMSNDTERNNLFSANREGICSLLGFIAIYLLSMYIGHWLQSKSTMNYKEFMRKLQGMTAVTSITWTLVIVSIFSIQIARVTCNFGYSVWILAIAITMTLFFMIIFDLLLNTIWPLNRLKKLPTSSLSFECETAYLLKAQPMPNSLSVSNGNGNSRKFEIPSIIEAINLNGLIYFLIGNILTGGVNIFLSPEERTDFESILILNIYMLLCAGLVYIMYRFKLRIA